MRIVDVSPDEPRTAALLLEYFALRTAGFDGEYLVVPPDPARFTPPAGRFLRADDDEESALGCGGIRSLDDDDRGRRMEVKHLYVRPAGRGRGIGAAVLAALEEIAAASGAATVVLDTNASLIAAAGLYARAGYRLTAPYNDNPNATHWYAKPL